MVLLPLSLSLYFSLSLSLSSPKRSSMRKRVFQPHPAKSNILPAATKLAKGKLREKEIERVREGGRGVKQ
jgi:hypothetical protein